MTEHRNRCEGLVATIAVREPVLAPAVGCVTRPWIDRDRFYINSELPLDLRLLRPASPTTIPITAIMPLIAQNPKNRIILGLMTFGPEGTEQAGARITDLGTFNKALDVLQERGYNEVDTARAYIGQKQEAFTAETKWKDRGLTLATKVLYPSQLGMYKADKVVESVENSLRDLGTDCVDILYLHAAVSDAAPLGMPPLTHIGPRNPLCRDTRGRRPPSQGRQVCPARPQQLHGVRGGRGGADLQV